MEFAGNNMSACGPSGYSPSAGGGQPQIPPSGTGRLLSGPSGSMPPTSIPYNNQEYGQPYRQYNSQYPGGYPQDYGQQQGPNMNPMQSGHSSRYQPGMSNVSQQNYSQQGHGPSPTLNQLLQQNSSTSQPLRNQSSVPMQMGPNNAPYRNYDASLQYQNWNQGKPHMHSSMTSQPTSSASQDNSQHYTQPQSYDSRPGGSMMPGGYNQSLPVPGYPGYPPAPQLTRYGDPYGHGPGTAYSGAGAPGDNMRPYGGDPSTSQIQQAPGQSATPARPTSQPPIPPPVSSAGGETQTNQTLQQQSSPAYSSSGDMSSSSWPTSHMQQSTHQQSHHFHSQQQLQSQHYGGGHHPSQASHGSHVQHPQSNSVPSQHLMGHMVPSQQHQPVTEPVSPEPSEKVKEETADQRPRSSLSESGRPPSGGFRSSPAPGGGGHPAGSGSTTPARPASSSSHGGPGSVPGDQTMEQQHTVSGHPPPMHMQQGPPVNQGPYSGQMHPGQVYGAPPGHRASPGRNMMPPHHQMYPTHPMPGGKPVPPYSSGQHGPGPAYQPSRPPMLPPQSATHQPPGNATGPPCGSYMMPQGSQHSSQPPPPPGYHMGSGYPGNYPGQMPIGYPGQPSSVAGMEQYRGSPGGMVRPGSGPPVRPMCPMPQQPPQQQPGPGYPGYSGGPHMMHGHPQGGPLMPPHQGHPVMNGPNLMHGVDSMSNKKEPSLEGCDAGSRDHSSGSSSQSQSSTQQQNKIKMQTPTTPKSESHPPTPVNTAVASPSQNSISSNHDEMESMLSSPGFTGHPGGPPGQMQPPPAGNVPNSQSSSAGSLGKLYEMGSEPERRQWIERYLSFMDEMGKALGGLPMVAKQPLDLFRFYLAVKERGGLMEVVKAKRWKEISQFVNINASASAAYTLRKNYVKYLLDYECHFDRGGTDPRPMIQQIEAMSGKKKKKTAASSGGGPGSASASTPTSDRAPSGGPPQVPNDFCPMEYQPPPHYMQNGQPPPQGPPRGYLQPPPGPYTNGHGTMPPPRGPPFGPTGPMQPQPTGNWRPNAYPGPPGPPQQQQNGQGIPMGATPPPGSCYAPPPPPQHSMPPVMSNCVPMVPGGKRPGCGPSPARHRTLSGDSSRRSDPLMQMLAGGSDPSMRRGSDWPPSGGVPGRSTYAGGMPPPPPPSHMGGVIRLSGGQQQQVGSGVGPRHPLQHMGMSPHGHHSLPLHHPHHQQQQEMMARMHQKPGFVTTVFKRLDHSYFPPNSVEATQPILTKRKKYASSDVCPLNPWKLYMALKSGLPAEVTWALDCLNILLRDDKTFQYFGLSSLPGLLEAVVELWRHTLGEVFGPEDFTTVLELDRELDKSVQDGGSETMQDEPKDDNVLSLSTPENGLTNTGWLEMWISRQAKRHGLELKKVLDKAHNYPLRSRQGVTIRLEKHSNGPNSLMNQRELMLFVEAEKEKEDDVDSKENQRTAFNSEECMRSKWLVGGGDTTCHIQPPMESGAPKCFEELFHSKRRRRQKRLRSESPSPVARKRQRLEEETVPRNATEEICTDGESILHTVADSQEAVALRCICVSTVLRNLSFLSVNEREIARHRGLLSLIGRLLLRGHEHMSAWPEEGEPWWLPYAETLRENALVILVNISGQLDFEPLPEDLVRPLLDGLLHWFTCKSAAAHDPLLGQSVISPRRLSLEALTKLCVRETNVEFVLSTPATDELPILFDNLASNLVSSDQVLKEMSLACVHYLARGGEGLGAVLLSSAKPCVITSILDFLEMIEQSARRVIETMGMESLQARPELMGTSLELVRRAGTLLDRLASVEANLPRFTWGHQIRLLQLVMSKVLDQQVAHSLAAVLYQLPAVEPSGPPPTIPDPLLTFPPVLSPQH